jgi:endonuclease/exonuclease/phosphatase family metal-dependent hydrolase
VVEVLAYTRQEDIVNFVGRSSLFIVTVFVAACSDSSLLDPTSSEVAAAGSPSRKSPTERLTVMTRNLYIGTDVDQIIGALASPDPTDDVPALFAGVAVLQRTSFPARAKGLADEIARARPHVVGLQEVEELDIDLSVFGSATRIKQDFIRTLRHELRERGLDYRVAGQVTNIEAAPADGIHLIDHDVILVDAERVRVGTVVARNYSFNLGTVAPGVDLVRGFVLIDARIGKDRVKIANTHLESGSQPPIIIDVRNAQAAELMAVLGPASPALLLGDFNDGPASPMHAIVTGAGFTDVWAALHPGAPGLTCCHVADLSNPVAAFDQRLDYVFARGLAGLPGRLQGEITIVGDEPRDRVRGPSYQIWPSDHAGVVASLPSENEGEEQEGNFALAR